VEAGGNRRRGRGGQRLLYWFRTPPGVRVGRVALDDEAMRLIEQHNPDVQFDWARLLKESAPEPPRRERDGRDGRGDRRERRDPRQPPRPRPMETSAAAAPPMPGPEAAEEIQELAEAAAERAAEHAEVLAAASGDLSPLEPASYAEPEPERELEPEREPERELERGEPERRDLSEPAEPAEPAELSAASPAAARLGADGLARLRARYLDLKGRLAEKDDLETDARAELAADLERLNPDAWVTPDEVSGALEQYESIFERLRSVVGRHPRRRV